MLPQANQHQGSKATEVLIAVMGPTGVGKSSFINKASGSQFAVGSGLRSCTSQILETKNFNVDGCSVVLIDTPGFDDTTLSDMDVLEKLAIFLRVSRYESGRKLTGIIYLHRISDIRMTGGARKNLEMFREVWGDDVMGNVVLATTMWDYVDLEEGESRLQELASDPQFFKPMLQLGAQILKYRISQASAHGILRQLLYKSPIVLKIQRELVDKNKELGQTGAGQVLQRQYEELKRRFAVEMKELQKELDQALEWMNQPRARELEESYRTLQHNAQRIEEDHRRLSVDRMQLVLRNSDNGWMRKWKAIVETFRYFGQYLSGCI